MKTPINLNQLEQKEARPTHCSNCCASALALCRAGSNCCSTSHPRRASASTAKSFGSSFLEYGYTVIRSSDETYSRTLQSMRELGNRFVVGFDRAVARFKATDRRDGDTRSLTKLELIPAQERTCGLYLVRRCQHLQITLQPKHGRLLCSRRQTCAKTSTKDLGQTIRF